jgi:hypothetical protein
MPQSEKVMGIDPAASSADPLRRPEIVKLTTRVTPCSVSRPVAVAVMIAPEVRSELSVIG